MLDEISLEREIELDRRYNPRLLTRSQEAARKRVSVRVVRVTTQSDIHPGVFAVLASLFAAMLAILAVTFAGDGETMFMIAICAFYGAMYFGTPLVLARLAARPDAHRLDWGSFLTSAVDTYTGVLSGRTALIQICMVPAALFICFAGMGLIIASVR